MGIKHLLLGPGSIAGVYLQVGKHEPLKKKGEKLEEKESSPIEDLMKEHGVVERILILYERLIDHAVRHQEVDIAAINRAAKIVDEYISNHHEKDE